MKKKLLSLFLALCMILSTAVALSVTTFASDEPATLEADDFTNAASGDTLTLMNKADWTLFGEALAALAADESVEKPFEGVTIKMGDDVTFNENMNAMAMNTSSATTGLYTWTPYRFDGNLDGLKKAAEGDQPAEYYTISGLYMNGGLFGHSYGTISNINFENCYSQNPSVAGSNYIAIVAMHNRNLIENVHVKNCHVVGQTTSGNYYIGGITAGPFGGTVRGCTFSGTIETGDTTKGYFGGIVGNVNSGPVLVENCVNYGTIISKKFMAGGIVGCGSGGAVTIRGCTNNGTINGGDYAGGIVGQSNANITCENVTNVGAVSGKSYIGGFIGRVKGTVSFTDCTNEATGTVTATGDTAAGFIGRTDAGSTSFTDCTNNAAVSGAKWVAGFIGDGYSSVVMTGCTNNGSITGRDSAGGLIGRFVEAGITANVENSVNNGAVSGALYGAGVLAYIHQSSTVNVTKAVNNGTITAGSTATGGIIGHKAAATTLNLTSCINISDYANVGSAEVAGTNCVALTPDTSKGEIMRTLWSAGFDLKEEWTMTENGVLLTAMYDGEKATPDASKEIVYKGYQLGLEGTNEANNIRFIAGMGDVISGKNYISTGFELVVNDADGVHAGDAAGNPLAVNDTAVYTSIKADGGKDTVTASDLECTYLSAVTISGISENAIVELTATLTETSGNVIRGTTVMIIIENGNVVAQFAV